MPREAEILEGPGPDAAPGPEAPPRVGQRGPAGEPATPARAKRLTLEDQLVDFGVRIGAKVSFVAPFTGYVMVGEVPTAAAGLAMLAKKNPKIKAALESMLAIGAYGLLLDFGVKIATAAAIEIGRLEPDSLPAQLLGLTDAWEELEAVRGATRARGEAESASGNGEAPAARAGRSTGLLADLEGAAGQGVGTGPAR